MTALIDLEAEIAVIGAMLQEKKLIDLAIERLDPEDFAEPLNGRIFALIVGEHAKGRRATPMILNGHLTGDEAFAAVGGKTYLARMAGDISGLFGFKDICRQLGELAARRRISDGLRAAADSCEILGKPIPEIVSEADAAISTKVADTVNHFSAEDCVTALEKSHDGPRSGVKCKRIKSLDSILGPLKPGQLIIGAARPGMGKTAVALSYAMGAAENGAGVQFISLEMGGSELGARMLADLCFDDEKAPIPYGDIRDGKYGMHDLSKIQIAKNRLRDMPFSVVDAGHLTIGRLNMLVRRQARRMEADGKRLDLVVIDYLQLLSPDGRNKTTYEAVSEISRGLKVMAKEIGVAVLALAQLSREVEKRPGARPQLSDLRDSGQIEQDADAVLFLLRPEYYLRQAEPPKTETIKHNAWLDAMEQAENVIEFILAKRRNGVTGTAKGKFYGAYQAVRG